MLTRLLGGLLRLLVGGLPERRREWGEAVYAEAAAVPAGAVRLRWLAGGLWVVARQAHAVRHVLWWLAVAAAGVAAIRAGWRGGSTVPTAAVDRGFLIALVALLAVLPWASRAVFGPVAATAAAKTARRGAYPLVCALVPVLIALSRYGGARFEDVDPGDSAQRSEMAHNAVVSNTVLLLLIGTYATAILALTARRSVLAPATLAIGTAAGLGAGLLAYALTPLGGTLRIGPWWLTGLCYLGLLATLAGVPMAAGAVATYRTGSTGQGTVAGLLAGAATALIVTVLTIPTMVAFPTHVHLKWANPDPDAPHGTPYELRMTVSDTAGRYPGVLILAPLLGAGLGAVGADTRRARAGAAARAEAAQLRLAGPSAGRPDRPPR